MRIEGFLVAPDRQDDKAGGAVRFMHDLRALVARVLARGVAVLLEKRGGILDRVRQNLDISRDVDRTVDSRRRRLGVRSGGAEPHGRQCEKA
jgi:hypothetical protein